MNVAIHDANILIDIVKLDLADALFSLDLNMRTTDAVWFELVEDQTAVLQPFVEQESLAIETFDKDEVDLIIQSLKRFRGLSFEDCSLIVAARKYDAMILTGDRKLRSVIRDQDLEVHGILWLFERMVLDGQLSKSLAVERLQMLKSMNQRLPLEELDHLITRWSR